MWNICGSMPFFPLHERTYPSTGIKKENPAIDYGIMLLEGLWWTDDMSSFSSQDKSNWK